MVAQQKTSEKAGQKAKAMITIEQTRSPIGRPRDQRATLTGLGLNKPGRRRTLEDTPAVRGMINKVAHLVRIVEASPKDAAKSASKNIARNGDAE